MGQHQFMTITIARGTEEARNMLPAGRWVELQGEVDSLVRRFGFRLLTQTSGAVNGGEASGERIYQVLGMREREGLGLEANAFDNISREVRDLVYLFSSRITYLGFGALQRMDFDG
jgi:hypothetical protein